MSAVATSASTTATQLETLVAGYGGNLAGLESQITANASSGKHDRDPVGRTGCGLWRQSGRAGDFGQRYRQPVECVGRQHHLCLQAAVGANSSSITEPVDRYSRAYRPTTRSRPRSRPAARVISRVSPRAAGAGGLRPDPCCSPTIWSLAGVNSDGSLNPVSPFEVTGGEVLMNKAVIGTITADQISANTTYTGNLSSRQRPAHATRRRRRQRQRPVLHRQGREQRHPSADRPGTGNDWGMWTWNGSGAAIFSATSIGVNTVATTSMQANAATSIALCPDECLSVDRGRQTLGTTSKC